MLAGNAIYQCGCVHYPTSDDNLLIIVLCVVIGLAVLICIVVAIAWCVCRKKPSDGGRRKDKTEDQDRRVGGLEEEQFQQQFVDGQYDQRYSRQLPSDYQYRT